MDGRQQAPKARQVAAAVIGNVLEWYDFIVFGLLTVVISRLFFPANSQCASLLLTTATFGVGFFMRPVGGLLLGIYADRKGRKAVSHAMRTEKGANDCGFYNGNFHESDSNCLGADRDLRVACLRRLHEFGRASPETSISPRRGQFHEPGSVSFGHADGGFPHSQ